MGAPAARALYRGLWRQVRRFQVDALPITGVVGLDAGPVCIDPLARLRAAFAAGGGSGSNGGAPTPTQGLSLGLQALRALPHQAAALEHAEEDARDLLARWAQLQARWADLRRRRRGAPSPSSSMPSSSMPPPPAPPLSSSSAPAVNTRVLEAGEEACALAYAATEEQAAERALDDDEAEEIRARARRVLALAEPRPRVEAARDLSELAHRAAEGVVAVAAASSSSSSSSPSSLLRYPSLRVRAAAAASAALFAYDGGGGGGGGGGESGGSSGSSGGSNANNNSNNPANGRLRSEPVEWVYDGVQAALPQPLLAGESAHSAALGSSAGGTSSGPPSRAARKGVPLALALAAARCLADAGLPGLVRCEPVCARDRDAEMLAAGRAEQGGSAAAGAAGAAAGGAAGGLSALPPAVAARQAGRTVAVAPATSTWLVRLDVEEEEQEENAGAAAAGGGVPSSWFADVTRRGELLSAEEARGRYPSLEGGRGGGPRRRQDARDLEEEEEEERATLALWREVARTLVLAHQRRGEADAVAVWMRAAMALDPAAGEWGRVL